MHAWFWPKLRFKSLWQLETSWPNVKQSWYWIVSTATKKSVATRVTLATTGDRFGIVELRAFSTRDKVLCNTGLWWCFRNMMRFYHIYHICSFLLKFLKTSLLRYDWVSLYQIDIGSSLLLTEATIVSYLSVGF